MMKLLTTFLLSLLCLFTYADDTKDYVTLSSHELIPGGGEVAVVASLNRVDNNSYTGFQMDIVIPESFDVVKTKSGRSEYLCVKLTGDNTPNGDGLCESTHSVDAQCITVEGKKTLRVACVSIPETELYGDSGPLVKFTLKANGYAKPGVANIQIINTKFGNGTTQYLVADRSINSISVSSSSTLSLSVSSDAHWSTCVLPFDAPVPTGVNAYTSSSYDDENVYLTEVQTFEAYTPYVLYSEDGYSGSLSGTVVAERYPQEGYVTEGCLNGAVVSQSIESGYVLQMHDSGVQFFAVEPGKSVTVPAGKCWMSFHDAGANARNIIISDVNGIHSTLSDRDTNDVFNLMGVRIQNPQAGNIYIKNGKKILKRQ